MGVVMKLGAASLLALLGAALGAQTGVQKMSKDRTITKVVKLLQAMLDNSKQEGDSDANVFGKFKCYCDTSEADKRASIKQLETEISLLESKIESTQGESGELSADVLDLTQKSAANKDAQKKADDVRAKELKAFNDAKKDREDAIKRLDGAMKTLTAVGADQTAGSDEKHKRFMAGFKGGKTKGKSKSLLTLGAEVSDALTLATALMTPKQRDVAASFVQEHPGVYSSQSTQVMGMFKQIADSLKAEMDDAISKEKKDSGAAADLKKNAQASLKEMTSSLAEKNKELGENDSTLSAKKSQLANAQKKLASEQDFLQKLLPLCEKKKKQYENRQLLRANEEAAISECISLLNSDEAFDLFSSGKTTSGTGGPKVLIQLATSHRHVRAKESQHSIAQQVLRHASMDALSTRLPKVVALLQRHRNEEGWVVITQIEEMLKVIVEEGKADLKKKKYCEDTRKKNKDVHTKKKKEALLSTQAIDKLTNLIKDPATGLLQQIAKTENSLEKGTQAQASQTQQRQEANVKYQKDVKNLVESVSLLKRAKKALDTYYDDLDKKIASGQADLLQGEVSLLQASSTLGASATPTPPPTPGTFKGQKTGMNDVTKLFDFIIKETSKELKDTHDAERKAQHDYEDAMGALKKTENDNQKSLSDLQGTLATKEEELLSAQQDLKATNKDIKAVEEFLASIKGGCDFIKNNYLTREKNRKTETDALNKAMGLLKATPAYKTFTKQNS